MTANRRDAIKARLPVGAYFEETPASVPGIAPALLEHLIDMFGECTGFFQLGSHGYQSRAEEALATLAYQAGREEILNYLIALAEKRI